MAVLLTLVGSHPGLDSHWTTENPAREPAEDTHSKSTILCSMLEDDLSEDATVDW